MTWYFAPLAPAVALAAALAFYPARRPGCQIRTSVWLASSVVVALSPCLIPLTAKPLRFVASLLAITLLVKLYDVFREPGLAERLDLQSYLAYLPNGYWLVLRREPGRMPVTRDLRRLGWAGPASLLSLLWCAILWRLEWSTVPFAIEHALKVSAVIFAVVLIGNASAAAYRLLGGTALDPMGNPITATTPAEFWRRWNRPAQHFLHEYAFMPAGGFRNAVRATLVTFGVSGLVHEYVFGIATGRIQGCQLLFFSLQGCAVAATLRVRASGRMSVLWIAGTLLFNLATSVLFFQSVNAVLPFYWPRGAAGS
jgi:MBOAT, membrane-bound O-acyltransferase family